MINLRKNLFLKPKKFLRKFFYLPFFVVILTFAHANDTLNPDLTFIPVSSAQGIDGRYLSVVPLPTVQIRFSEKMKEDTLTAANIQLVGIRDNTGAGRTVSINLKFTYDSASLFLSLTPKSELERGWLYELTLSSGLQDLAGNGLISERKVFFETLMDKNTVNSFTAADGKTQVVIPPSALSEDASMNVSVVSGGVNAAPKTHLASRASPGFGGYNSLQYVLPSALDEATKKLRDMVGSFAQEVTVREFAAINQNGERVRGSFNAPVTIVMPYLDQDGDGIVDGVTPQVKVKDLKVYLLDETRNSWNRIANAEIDPVNKRVTLQVNHFSVYAVMGAPDGDVSAAHAFPVPFNASLSSAIRFTNLPSQGKIKIYTVTGEQVFGVNFTITSGESVYDWNVKNTDGEDVSSGVYPYIIESGTNIKTGKLVIVR